MSKPHSKSIFQESWFCNPKYSLWVTKYASNTTKAYCELCCKTIYLKPAGSNVFYSHQKGQKHQALEKAKKTKSMKLFLSSQSSELFNFIKKEGCLSPQSSLKPAKVGPAEVQKGHFLPLFWMRTF